MKNFITDIFKKLLSSILFAAIMFVASYCVITGEFPPKIANMKKGFHNMQAQIQQLKKIQESQLSKLSQAADQINGSTVGQINTQNPSLDQAEIKYQQALLDKIKDLEARIARLESKSQ